MTTAQDSHPPSYVVGIGASAGGLDAIERFFARVPTDSGMAFVVVQHLSPDFKSLMDELLARHTELPIHLVEDGMRVEANTVYLIPPKKEMIISDGRLLLSERGRKHDLTLPIDVFFRSLAQDCGARAVAIVLSGGGSDGSRGVRDVYEAGGFVIVQDVESAQFDGMPKATREAGVAHWVLKPEEMPGVLLEHAVRPLPAKAPALVPHTFGTIYRMLEEEFGLDFTHYKPSTITRRIERRIALARTTDIVEYAQRLKNDREELDVLYRDLLIGVTRFFRDQGAFEVLETRVLPELLRAGAPGTPLRIWVAGCATGEEPYSIAIALRDLMAKLGIDRTVKIFATDVHAASIDRAARALYDDSAVENVSPERLARYFSRVGKMYQVAPDVRQMVVFATHNVMKDAPFTRVDLISCRNLLIYFQTSAQQKVLSLFHFALNKDGILLLGPSETLGPNAPDFLTVDKHWQVYRKQTDSRMSINTRLPPSPAVATQFGPALLSPIPGARPPVSQLLATYDALLDEVMPPSLLVSADGELLHAFAGASRFLRLRDGRPALDVLDVVDGELKMVLVGGLRRAVNEQAQIVFKGVRISDASEVLYDVTLRKVAARTGSAGHVLISFEGKRTSKPHPPATAPALEIEADELARHQLVALESELGHVKENLQAAIEELQSSNEELQSSNEELQTSNEELQSTNEELQSVNEELYTVNAEYQRKISELTELTNDMDNLLSSTDVGTIFLDRDLKIRKFTPQIAETFDLVPHDVGRPIETFAHRLDHPELMDDLRKVLETGAPIERDLRGAPEKAFFLRILPYRAKGKIEGVVVTTIDVSGLKAAEDALFHERYLLNSLLRSIPDAIYFKDARGKFIRTNDVLARRLGFRDARDAVGKSAMELPDPKVAHALHDADEAILRTGAAELYRLEKRAGDDGRPEWDLVTRLPLRDSDDRIVGVIAIFRNVTEQKFAEQKIQEAVRRRDQFLAMLSHELRNPLGAIVTATGLLKSGAPSAATNSRRLLGVLERQSQQMAHLLDDLLEASRVTQNKIELKTRTLDLRDVLREAVEAVRGQFEARQVELTVKIADQPLCVHGDSARLQQIHVNLLNNAAKYTPRNGHVRLEAKREDGEIVVSVVDDGVGIARDMLETVFDLFVQSNRTLDRSAGGLGVGLTLVRSLVELHGGSVEAHSQGEGTGSSFVVRLPFSADTPSVEAPPIARTRVPLRSGAKIVVVEDNEDSREMLCEMLADAGYECHTAGNGRDALALVESVRPAVAILDVGLPEIDGFKVARMIRDDPRLATTRLIALTGYGRSTDRALAREAGFDEHLVKPVHAEQLLALLADMSSDGAAARSIPSSEALSSGPTTTGTA